MSILKAFGADKNDNKDYEKAVYCVTLLNNIINKNISAQLLKYNLTPGKFNVLMAIKHLGGKKGTKQVTISKYLVLSPSNITKLIDKLEKEKLVVRSQAEEDRRINTVTITDRGSNLVDIASEISTKKFKEMTDKLNKGKLKNLSSSLIEWLTLFN